MGFKKVLGAFKIFDAAAMSGTNVLTSQVINIQNLDNIGIEFVWTGTPAGTFEVLGSISGVNFIPITFIDPLPAPTGGAGSWLTDLGQVSWHYLIIKYTNSGGTGVLNAWVGGKDVN